MSKKCILKAAPVLPSLEHRHWQHSSFPADLVQPYVCLCLLLISEV